MKIATTRVQCRGCQTTETIKFKAPSLLSPATIPFKCKKCGSECVAEIRRGLSSKQIKVKVNLIQHTQTLLNILKRRRHA